MGIGLTLFFLICGYGYGQEGFRLPNGQKKDRIAFDFVNNLVVIPVEVNGKPLSFLLDTGVNYTLLFSLYENDSLQINNVTPVKIRGVGSNGNIDALKSVHNNLKIGDAEDKDHTFYVIFDEAINFSPRMGIPIHGVIGFDFFKDFVVRTDYVAEHITIFDPLQYKKKRCRNCEEMDLRMIGKKPYISQKIESNGATYDVNLLIDSGASDAIWLFDEGMGIVEQPKNYFKDFLGLGLSGGVFGKRSKLDKVLLGRFEIPRVNVSYPDSIALKSFKAFKDRSGTLGAGILKRFTVTMDYRSRQMTLRKNKFFGDPFHYNMAGLIVEHDGLVPASEVKNGTGRSFNFASDENDSTGKVSFNLQPVFTFFLAPKYIVSEVRKGSPADLAEILQGDELISINGKAAYKYDLESITALFSSKSGRRINIVVNRDGAILRKKFFLKEVL
ncbi:MAG: hypothetical protein Aureis2KO_21950 [Aureisphaera sp.]